MCIRDRRYPVLALLGALLLGAWATFLDARRPPPVTSVAGVDVEIFVQPGCPHCEAARRWLGELRKDRPAVSYTHLPAHETVLALVCRLLLEHKKPKDSTAPTHLHISTLTTSRTLT